VLRWRHLTNACEVNAHLIGWQYLGAVCFWQWGRGKRGSGKRGTRLQGWKTREWKTRYQTAGVENAGVENAAPDCRGGKRGSLKSMKSEDFENVFLTVLTERIVWKLAQTLLLNKGGLSRDDFLAS